MLSRFFHAWERRLAAATKDRLVRPFEWGAEWLTSEAQPEAPDISVDRWIDEVMRDTPSFFHTPPTSDYDFIGARAEVQRKGEAGTLRFSSAFALIEGLSAASTALARPFQSSRTRSVWLNTTSRRVRSSPASDIDPSVSSIWVRVESVESVSLA